MFLVQRHCTFIIQNVKCQLQIQMRVSYITGNDNKVAENYFNVNL